jgi:(2Fe-2S) ferredoxin
MSKDNNSQILEFRLKGRFLGFILEDGYKIKGLRLGSVEGECGIKLAKPLRTSLGQVLIPGDWIEVTGERILDWKSGKLKLKAYEVTLTVPSNTQTVTPAPAKPSKPQACIMVCQKSDCCQKGAMEVCKVLEEELRDRGLADQVTIKKTGCMKQCKAGPNIVIMPDKTTYRRVRLHEIRHLLDKHFTPVTNPVEAVPEPSLVG